MEMVVEARDGRKLAVTSAGAATGVPIFLLHGTPGSRNGPQPRGIVLDWLGVRLIGYDRPGYGKSTRQPGRTVADSAEDLAAIADALDIGRFSVVGRSGGGPHALAAAALLGDRVDTVATLVSLAPYAAEGLDWYGGMTSSNVREYSEADDDRGAVESSLREEAARVREDPESLLKRLHPELTPSDLRIVADFGIRRLLTDTYSEGTLQGGDGWIDDVLAFRRPWGFDVSDITVPTLLWHGAEDRFSPVEHTLWLAGHLPDARMVKIEPGASHFSAVEVLPKILKIMVGMQPALR
jgi:pimeloyl-ACP methyl ester carboxylesterase